MAAKEETRVVGWKLARRVVESDLYDQLNDMERAECDELVERGNGWEGPPDRQSPAGISCRLARCQYQADCTRIDYCQATIFQSANLRSFVVKDLVPTIQRLIADLDTTGQSPALRQELESLRQRAARNQ